MFVFVFAFVSVCCLSLSLHLCSITPCILCLSACLVVLPLPPCKSREGGVDRKKRDPGDGSRGKGGNLLWQGSETLEQQREKKEEIQIRLLSDYWCSSLLTSSCWHSTGYHIFHLVITFCEELYLSPIFVCTCVFCVDSRLKLYGVCMCLCISCRHTTSYHILHLGFASWLNFTSTKLFT